MNVIDDLFYFSYILFSLKINTLLIRLLSSIYKSTIIDRSPVLTCETYTYYALILRNYKGSLVVEKFPYHYVLEEKVSCIYR